MSDTSALQKKSLGCLELYAGKSAPLFEPGKRKSEVRREAWYSAGKVLKSSCQSAVQVVSKSFKSPKATTMAAFLLMRPCIFATASTLQRALHSTCLSSKLASSGRISKSISFSSASKLEIHGLHYYSSKLKGHCSRRFSIEATNVSDSDSKKSPTMQFIEQKIKEQLNADKVIVTDVSGDGQHVCIDVISSAFEGQSTVNRQRMVYKAIWEELQSTLHAVDKMTTKTPAEAAAAGNS